MYTQKHNALLISIFFLVFPFFVSADTVTLNFDLFNNGDDITTKANFSPVTSFSGTYNATTSNDRFASSSPHSVKLERNSGFEYTHTEDIESISYKFYMDIENSRITFAYGTTSSFRLTCRFDTSAHRCETSAPVTIIKDPILSGWHDVFIDFTATTSNVTVDENTGSYDFGTSSPEFTFVHNLSPTVDGFSTYVDDIVIFSGGATTTPDISTSENTCLTCSRIISHIPSTGQTIATTTSFQAEFVYYLNSSDASFFSDPKLEVTFQKPFTEEQYTIGWSNLLENTETLAFADVNNFFTATGTYSATMRLYNEWGVLPDQDVFLHYFTFNVVEVSSASELVAYASSTLASQQDDIEYFEQNLDIPAVIAQKYDSFITEILHLPPWGYITVFLETMQNGATSSLGIFQISFPTSSPMFGTTLDLNLDTGFQTAIQNIRDEGVESEHGDSFETFMFYWETFFYFAFIFWLIRTVSGMQMLDHTSEEKSFRAERRSKRNNQVSKKIM